MKYIFCGSEIKGNFISEICRRKKEQISFTGANSHIASYEDQLFSEQYDVVVIDVSDLIDETNNVVDYIVRLRKAKSCKVIIFAPGYSYRTVLIAALIDKGFVNFVLASGLGTQIEEFEKCIDGYYDENGVEGEIAQEIEEEQEREKTSIIKTIGICGTMNRIGTTTQCMQLIKYLLFKGYKAAYLEANTSMYIERCTQLYADAESIKNNNYITYNDIDMYNGNNMVDALKKYDYLVCDYGAMDDPSFNKISFMEKDIKIFVAGSKPNEFDKIQPVLQSIAYKDAYFIFNFIPEGDKKDLLEMMCERAEKSIFTGYCPDPFDYVSGNDFEKLLPIDQKIEELGKEKKKLFSFPRLRKERYE